MRVSVALFALFVAFCAGQATLQLQAIVRDFTPSHPDFEHYLGDGRGAVLPTLDSDGKPQLNPNPATWSGVFTGVTQFAEWYRDTPGVSYVPSFLIQLNLTDIGGGIFEFDEQAYFPIDNRGFGNYLNYGHNFHFTTEIHTSFTYLEGQVFNFCGDDDLYVFANGFLILDLGGVHGTECASVALADVAQAAGLVNGSAATLAIFNAERHTVGSDMKIDTSIVLIAAPITPPAVGRTVYFCGVTFPNYGAGVVGTVPSDPTFTSFGSVSFSNFNAISFANYTVVNSGGDIQGRLAVQNNFVSTGGYSVGIEINSGGASATDLVLPFSFVVGNNAEFDAGSIFPDGSNQAHFSPAEFAFVGGTFTAPAYLQARRTGGPAPGLLSGDFANALAYYTLLSTELAATTPNTQWTIANSGGLTITCNDQSGAYYVLLDDASFNSVNYYADPVNCNLNGFFVLSVTGGSVSFGQSQQRFVAPEYFLYNFPGTGRVITSLYQPEGSILAPGSTLNQPTGTIVGNVVVGSISITNQINRLHCPATPPPPTPSPSAVLCPYFETNCNGLTLPIGATVSSFRDFNLVSFGDLVDFGGDVQGRVAVGNNADVSGFSVGRELQTLNGPDGNLPFAFVVSGNLIFSSGGVYPDGSNNYLPGIEEGIYVGGDFTGPLYLQQRITGGPGRLDAYFNAARQCYSTFSTQFAAVTDNVVQSVQYGGLFLHCNSATAAAYSVTVLDTVFNSITYYTLDNCNFQASWVINIAGSGTVDFFGGSFPAVAGGLVYNVLGTNRVVNVTGTGVTGHILAPWNFLNQTASVIVGKVVVGNVINLVQVNKPACVTSNPPVTLSSPLTQNAAAGSNTLNVASKTFIVGDKLNFGSTVTAISADGKTLTISPPLQGALGVGTVISTVVTNPTASRVYVQPVQTAGASTMVALAGLLMALLALAL
jgi:fibro-slime domain-containing protein/choice-of-anchor A domain-containing protein